MRNDNNNIRTLAVVLSGGRGTRMGGDVPKQYMEVCGFPLIYYSLKAFQESFVDEIVLVCGQGDEEYCRKEIAEKYDFTKVRKVVAGGKERYNSVLNGLNAAEDFDYVFIHDGARPFITGDILRKALDETMEYGATVVAVPSKDTVKIADEDGFAKETPNRDSVWIMQTPQTFKFDEIRFAYRKLEAAESDIKKRGIAITDDAMVMELFGQRDIKFVMGSYRNIKITTPEDLIIAKAYIEESGDLR